MIKKLSLQNFRAFANQSFGFSRLNIFVGPNNSGKSSAISALNLLAQTIDADRAGAAWVLRGKYDDLGTYIDVVHGNVPRTPITLKIAIGIYQYDITFKYRFQRKETEIIKYEITKKTLSVFEFRSTKDSFKLKYAGKTIDQYLRYLPNNPKKHDLRPEFVGPIVHDRRLRALLFRHNETATRAVRAKLSELQEAHFELRRATSALSTQLESFESVSPFRDPPQRTFLFSGERPQEVGRTGSNTVDILVADNFEKGASHRNLVGQVSAWFAGTGMAQGIAIRALTSRHYELCVIDKDGRKHNISDVGFGCSQVLPVLVGGINAFSRSGLRFRDEPILVVQEPEIHLHPDAQAQLGSFFVGLLRLRRGQIFIETHSSNLVLRVQTHIAKGQISAKDVRVFYVRKTKRGARVTAMSLSDEGVFEPPWPGRFFPQRQIESLNLARAAMDRRQRKSSQK